MRTLSATCVAIAAAISARTLLVSPRVGRSGPYVAISDAAGIIEAALSMEEARTRVVGVFDAATERAPFVSITIRTGAEAFEAALLRAATDVERRAVRRWKDEHGERDDAAALEAIRAGGPERLARYGSEALPQA